jgi:3-deoxy-manno-octulosonate cytidylyltransferase (CMP-KDO synthetase)
MVVIIPARFASVRLPGKPLLDIAGKPLLQHVYDRARDSGADEIIIATDDARIRQAAEQFGAQVCMTSDTHRSGTDRIAEVIQKLGIDSERIVVNLQGDEPLMPACLIKDVADTLRLDSGTAMATACKTIETEEMLRNPNVVKVVKDNNGHALYFSRAPIPFRRDEKDPSVRSFRPYRHIGLYAYRAGFILRFTAWPPCPLEQIEQLEQLRALCHGERIAVIETNDETGEGVDTPEDLERVRNYFINKLRTGEAERR